MSPADKIPPISALRELLTPERVALVKSDPQKLALAKEIAKMLSSNPAFMKSAEALSTKHEAEFKNLLSDQDLKSFGWESPEFKRPSPAAAAAAAAALAAVVPVPA